MSATDGIGQTPCSKDLLNIILFKI